MMIRAGGRRFSGAARGDQASHGVDQLAQTLAAPGGDWEHLQAAVAQLPDRKFRNLPCVWNIDLVQCDEPRPVFQTAVSFELRLDDIKIGNRIAARLIGGAVDHMDYRGAAFDVAQEVEAEPPPLTRSGDQPRNISNCEADVAGDDDSQVGNKAW